MKKRRGIVAAGHEITANAAAEILRAGGNAFDATLAALFASCVAEPVLSSLGGGGFLLAHDNSSTPRLYDFFAQTPINRPSPKEIDFHPILADFGTAQQEFHIGMGSIATPGVIKGAFEIHRQHGSMPMREIVQPACEAAHDGITVNNFQHYISEIVAPIIKSSPEALRLHSNNGAEIANVNDKIVHHEMADTFAALASEGDALFYQGELGTQLLQDSAAHGGCLQRQDLALYQVMTRKPLSLQYHGTTLYTNPAPSLGGTLIAFALALLEPEKLNNWPANSYQHLLRVARAQQLTQHLRKTQKVDLQLDDNTSRKILANDYLTTYRESMRNHHVFPRGTTQISVADTQGNLASMTLSNGEGAGYVIPNSGIMMNNMLGEEDINPHGFNNWPTNSRIASMMSPTLLFSPDNTAIVTGSGGSNRIRSAILQVLINLVDFSMSAKDAVEQARVHFENELLHIEAGPSDEAINALEEQFPNHRLWPEKNLFFGGAHTVICSPDGELQGQGDSRRGGVSTTV
ncbi:MAG: gamma-glutamyltransferase [Chromatiales bacterium]|nr:gamma-glutamyltransferase [Chromatiales bacterium]